MATQNLTFSKKNWLFLDKASMKTTHHTFGTRSHFYPTVPKGTIDVLQLEQLLRRIGQPVRRPLGKPLDG